MQGVRVYGRIFRVSCSEYYSGLERHQWFATFLSQVKPTMSQLIERYEIRQKSVLSIGSSWGWEEYWLFQYRNSLHFVDIDEGKSIESYLRTLSTARNDDQLTFFVGDASEYIGQCQERYDVVYISSLTPDEYRRVDIIRRYRDETYGSFSSLINYILRNGRLPPNWPDHEKPFMDLVMKYLDSLRDGGLFIAQLYAGGVDLKKNPHFIPLVEEQLRSASVILLEVYYQTRRPWVNLIVGYKGSHQEATRFLKRIDRNPIITAFHGRCDDPRCRRAFDLLQPNPRLSDIQPFEGRDPTQES
jgi:hypothetical protein